MEHLFNSLVDVLRITSTADDFGGSTEVEVVLHNNLKCRINWSKGTEKVFLDKDTWFRDAKLYCKVVDIQTRDRIRYKTSTPVVSTKDYEVVNVSNPDNVGKYLIVEMKLVE